MSTPIFIRWILSFSVALFFAASSAFALPALQWEVKYPVPITKSLLMIHSSAVDPRTGNIYVVGTALPPPTSTNNFDSMKVYNAAWFVSRVHPDDGSLDSSWGTGGYVFGPPNGGNSQAFDVAVDVLSGNVFVVGIKEASYGDDAYWLVKYEEGGTPICQGSYNPNVYGQSSYPSDQAYTVAVDQSGQFAYVGGSSNSHNTIVKFNTGNCAPVTSWGNGLQNVMELEQGSSGALYAAGYSFGYQKYDTSGTVLPKTTNEVIVDLESYGTCYYPHCVNLVVNEGGAATPLLSGLGVMDFWDMALQPLKGLLYGTIRAQNEGAAGYDFVETYDLKTGHIVPDFVRVGLSFPSFYNLRLGDFISAGDNKTYYTSGVSQESGSFPYNFSMVVAKFEENERPSLTSFLFSDDPDPVDAGNPVNLRYSWADPDADQGRVHFCRTNSIIPSRDGGRCAGDTLASSDVAPPGTGAMTYTTKGTDAPLITYYVFACDVRALCTPASNNSGTITVIPPNLPPQNPLSLGQFRSDCTTAIPNGGWTNTPVCFKGNVCDPDNGNAEKLQLEIKTSGSTYANTCSGPGGTCNESSMLSAKCPATAQASVSVSSGFTNGSAYQWQGRAQDNIGAISAFRPFNIAVPNFRIDTTAPIAPTLQAPTFGVGDTSCNTIELSWIAARDDESGIVNYEIWRKTGPTGSFGKIATQLSPLRFTDSGRAPLTQYFYYIKAINGAGLSIVSNTEDTTTTACPIPKPDLIVASGPTLASGLLQEDQMLAWSGVIKNQGDASAPDSTATFYVDLGDDNEGLLITPSGHKADITISTETVVPLTAGQSSPPVLSDLWKAVGGTHRIIICADDPPGIPESLETNNCSATTGSTGVFTIAGKADIRAFPPTVAGTLDSGVALSFNGTVQNEGGTPTGSFANEFYLDINNDGVGEFTTPSGAKADLKLGASNISNLDPNDQTNLTSFSTWTAATGTHRVILCADTTNGVTESDETNNCSNATASAPDGVFTVGKRPDLIVSSAPIRFSGTPQEGFLVTFKATVKNQGEVSTPSPFTTRFYIDYNADGSINETLTPDPATTILLAPGDTAQVISGSWTAIAGTHRIIACADDPNVITESLETNNCSNSLGAGTQGTGVIFIDKFRRF